MPVADGPSLEVGKPVSPWHVGAWDYSDSGAQGYRPPAGSVEGWCYTGTPWALIGTAAGLAAAVAVLVLVARRRRSGPSGALGGR